MATYIGIKGVDIQTIAGDPANPTVGQVWYNTTANTLKGYGQQGTGAWGSEADMLTARGDATGCGVLTAAIATGGYSPAAPPVNGLMTEEYDGTSWSEVNDLNAASWNTKAGQGTQTAVLKPGENSPAVGTEEYDGTSWAAGGDSSTANRMAQSGGGTQTAGMMFSGRLNPAYTTYTPATEEYNGSSWSASGVVNTGASYMVGGGTQTAAIKATGKPGSIIDAETYDGSTWTSVASCNTATHDSFSTTNGTQTAFLKMTGTVPGVTVNVEEYNGSTWTEVANVTTGRQGGVGAGTALGGLVAGGSGILTCESYVIPDAIKTFTSS